jgi:DNA-binding NarL/FixJ family response regulator
MKTVLIVEDDPLYRFRVRRMLQNEFEIAEASTLSEALAYMSRHPVDAVLLDTGLPDCYRHDAVPMIKQAGPTALVLVLSGYDSPDSIRSAIEGSASGYFIKGRDDYDAFRLVSSIRLAIASNETCRMLDEATRLVISDQCP